MALDDILNSIRAEAEKKVHMIEDDGNKVVAQHEREWMDRIGKRREDILARAQAEADRKVSQAVLELKARGKQKVLAAKQELLDKVFSRALERLLGFTDEEYVEFMVVLIGKLPSGHGELVSTKGKESLLARAVEKSGSTLNISSDTVDGSGGFVFRTKTVYIDNTFESLIDGVKGEVKVELGRILFD